MNGTLQRPPMGNATEKPLRGEATLDRRDRRAGVTKHETAEMRAAKKRDNHQCRRPKCPYAKKQLTMHACHMKDSHRGMGGDPSKKRTTRARLITLCAIDHTLYDRGALRVQPMTPELFDGPCMFNLENKRTRVYEHIGTEKRYTVSVTRAVR